MAAKPLPSPEVLRQFLDYDPATGLFQWKARNPSDFSPKGGKSAEHLCAMWNARYAWTIAFTADNGTGYKASKIDHQRILAHRAAWKMMTDEEPPEQIDHIDGKRDNNAWANLRAATNRINSMNRGRRTDNTSGMVGVSFHKRHKKWTAYINAHGRTVRLGEFEAQADAITCRKAAEIEFGYHPNHGKTREINYASV